MKNILNTVLLIFFITEISAQDIHFSQFYASPLYISPASGGNIQGKHRFTLHHKNQWKSVSAPYNTYSAQYDNKIPLNQNQSSYISIGGSVFKDVAGDNNLSELNAIINIAYGIKLTDKFLVSTGLAGGIMQRSIDISKGQWGNQYNGTSYDSSLPNNENISSESYFQPDFNAGLSLHYIQSNKLKVSINAGAYHLNNVNSNFSNILNTNLYKKWAISSNIYFEDKNERFVLQPNILFSFQGNANELLYGSLVGREITSGTSETQILVSAGIFVRNNDAFIPTVELSYNLLTVGVSYDINQSSLAAYSEQRGGFEFYLRYAPSSKDGKTSPSYSPRIE